MLPWSVLETIFGELAMDFSTWIAAGLMVVVGRRLGDRLQRRPAAGRRRRGPAGRIRGLAPILRMAMAYPLAGRFRTGVTLAMFTLVVFTLVTGTVTSGSFMHAAGDVERFGGGFDVRASTAGVAPIEDLPAAIRREPTLDAADFPVAASQSFLPLDARQVGRRPGGRDLPRPRARRRLPRRHDLRPGRAGARLRQRRRRLAGAGGASRAGGGRRDGRPAPRQLQLLGPALGLPPQRLLPRGRRLRPRPGGGGGPAHRRPPACSR